MPRQILIFGNNDKSENGFPTAERLQRYISEEIFSKEAHRYRHTLPRNLNDGDLIVLSWEDKLFGHFEIVRREDPTTEDLDSYHKTKRVYVVRPPSILYEKPVELSRITPTELRRGHSIPLSETEFGELIRLAAALHEFPIGQANPDSPVEQERLLAEVRRRLGQGEFRRALLVAYKSRCAVTNCDAVDALEAAHIDPYSGPNSNAPCNGLLLRSDIHVLFDAHCLGIHPDTLQIALSPRVLKTCYADLAGKKITLPEVPKDQPKGTAIASRWRSFCEAANGETA